MHLLSEMAIIGRQIKKHFFKISLNGDIKQSLLYELINHNVILELSDGYEFVHESIHQAALNQLNTEDKMKLHRKYFNQLLKQSNDIGPTLAIDLATHCKYLEDTQLSDINHNDIADIFNNAATASTQQGNYLAATKFYQLKLKYTSTGKIIWNLAFVMN